jgi:hypothetical protein
MEEKKAAEEAEYAAKKAAEDAAGKYLVTEFPSVAHLNCTCVSSPLPPLPTGGSSDADLSLRIMPPPSACSGGPAIV